MLDALGALVPSIGVGLLFWFVVRAIISADRRERAALAELDRAEQEKAAGNSPANTTTPSAPVAD